jgi:hypothetical protein
MKIRASIQVEEQDIDRQQMTLTVRVLSVLLIPLCVLACGVGLFVPRFYRDAPTWVIQTRAQDLVTLVLAVPLLAISLLLGAGGSIRGYLLWMGVVGYLIYSYAIYCFSVQFNELFLVYVVIFGLSVYTLVLGLVSVDPRVIARSACSAPTGWIGGFLIAVCILVALLWLADVMPVTIAGRAPSSIVGTGLLTNPVEVLDLGIVLPGGVVTGLFLLARRPWGYLLGGYYLVKFATLGVAVNAISVLSLAAGQPVDVTPGAIFAVITICSVVLTWLYLKAVRQPELAIMGKT